MKIAVLGTEPNSCHLAPFGDGSWKIWGCSPGLYPVAPRVDAWFEIHRWEPPVIGAPAKQVPWFTPEYVIWMDRLSCPVWMYSQVPQVKNSRALPVEDLVKKYGFYFFTSTIAYMLAMAIEEIEVDREKRAKLSAAGAVTFAAVSKAAGVKAPIMDAEPVEEDCIGLWGIDMSAKDEYSWQRPGCHFFISIAHARGIKIVVPEESDILCPPPLYGISESWHRQIKFLARTRSMEGRVQMGEQASRRMETDVAYLRGMMDDNEYHRRTWVHDTGVTMPSYDGIFQGKHIFEDPLPKPEELIIRSLSTEVSAGRELTDILQQYSRSGEGKIDTLKRVVKGQRKTPPMSQVAPRKAKRKRR